ncbi:MAG: hypothetical protein CMJ32_00405 [Phycisphaerae bacterium]|nr:hypothetical protein [Phycisphaerae bacterium]
MMLAMFITSFLLAGTISPQQQAETPGQVMVRPGGDWKTFVQQARPGQEILLMPGLYRASVLEGVKGEPGRPITIRSSSSTMPATIVEGETGLKLIDCSHLHIQGLRIVDATGTGLEITGRSRTEGVASSRSISIKDVFIGTLIVRSPPVGLRIDTTDDCTVTGMIIQAPSRTGCRILGSTDITLDSCYIIAGANTRAVGGTGIDIGRDVSKLHVHDCRIIQPCRTGIRVGPTAPSATGTSEPVRRTHASNRIQITECGITNTSCSLALGSCDDVVITNNSFKDATKCFWRVFSFPGTSPYLGPNNVRFELNMFTWEVGQIESFCCIQSGATFDGIALGRNLFWSAEMPAALSVLEPIAGKIQQPQVFDVDPRLDPRGVPGNPEAMEFGISSR